MNNTYGQDSDILMSDHFWTWGGKYFGYQRGRRPVGPMPANCSVGLIVTRCTVGMAVILSIELDSRQIDFPAGAHRTSGELHSHPTLRIIGRVPYVNQGRQR